MTPALVALTVMLPLLLFFTYGQREARTRLAKSLPLAALPGLVLALWGTDQPLLLPWLLEGSVWGLDPLRRVFLGFTALVWMIAGLYALYYVPFKARHRHIMLFWLLSMNGNLGLILARDIASFYTFFAVMTFAAYGLIIHWGNPEAIRAGRLYIIMSLAGEMALLAGLTMAAAPQELTLMDEVPAAVAASEYRHWIMGLLITGFGVKAGLPLLHFWLPLSHTVAPTPASAVLSGVMIKAGLFGWLITLPLIGQAWPVWGTGMVVAGLTGAFGGALIGVCQRTPKAVLAYSSISQMGIMTVVLGVALVSEEAQALVSVMALYALHHSLAKASLFLGAGSAPYAGNLPRWLFWAMIWLPGLSLTGLLFTSGAAAKGALTDTLAGLGAPPDIVSWLGPLLVAAAVATTLLVSRFAWCLREQVGSEDSDKGKGMQVCWLLAVIASALVFWLLPRPELPEPLSLGLSHPLDYLWPPLAGLLLAAAAWKLGLKAPPIPTGDLIITLERGWKQCRLWIMRAGRSAAFRQRVMLESSRGLGGRLLAAGGRLLNREDDLLARSGLSFVILLALLLIFLLL